MTLRKLLIANRGEVAIRIARTARECGIATVAVYSSDDSTSWHREVADESVALNAAGPPAYLDGDHIVQIAADTGCDAIHPGYGFLSEQAGFARTVRDAGHVFVGPQTELLELLGDKAAARAKAAELGLPILRGTAPLQSSEEGLAFLASLPAGSAVIVKAVAGGGGRGMRIVRNAADLANAIERSRSEATAAFGDGRVYIEEYLPRARHIEVQVAGDSEGNVTHLWERDCSVQRRHQKLIEIAPSPNLLPEVRTAILAAAERLARELRFDSIGTFEFLLAKDGRSFAFIEANPRLQVEHTVTEELLGIDLVQLQLELAGGKSLADLGLESRPAPGRGYALQARVNMESPTPDGTFRPAVGTLREFQAPTGPGIRVDTFGYRGFTPNSNFDALLAKVIVRTRDSFEICAEKADHALSEFRIEGAATNVGFLRAILRHDAFRRGGAYTDFVDDHWPELLAATTPSQDAFANFAGTADRGAVKAGNEVDREDPLAVLTLGKSPLERESSRPSMLDEEPADGQEFVRAPLQGTIIEIAVNSGDAVRAGQQLCILNAMKMEHIVAARSAGVVIGIGAGVGDTVLEDSVLFTLAVQSSAETSEAADDRATLDLDRLRPELEEVEQRRQATLDEARPDAVAKRRATGQRTARENIEDLVDPGSFVEYGQLAVAAHGPGDPIEELVRRSPADGFVCGVGSVNTELFGEEHSRCAVMSYDYTVFAGTQGAVNHHKHDRIFEVAEEWRLPVIFFTEGGGGRSGGPSPSRHNGQSGMRTTQTFKLLARLSGLVPLVAVSSGRNFAGSAAILGPCDVVIATRNANIGMGGPAVIEGGGLGVYRPEEIGPADALARNGVIDVLVEDEAEAVQVAKKYLSYFQGRTANFECADQRELRLAVPENRKRAYDVRQVIATLADTDSVLELRSHFGRTMVTAFIRVAGRPIGVIANNASFLGGAIDSDGSDKAARFMQLCDAFNIPILSLCDTPGMMVGPEAEEAAQVKHCSRLFVVGANLQVPFMMIVLRKCYGLGGLAMSAGNLQTPSFVVSWPTGEFAGMNLEGQIKLAYRDELAAIADLRERTARYEELLKAAYDRTKALRLAEVFDLDDVIDPADSRRWIERTLQMGTVEHLHPKKRRPCVDTW